MKEQILKHIKNYQKFTCNNLDEIIDSYNNIKFSDNRLFIKNIISAMKMSKGCNLININQLKKELYERFLDDKKA